MTPQQERLLIALARAYLWNSGGSGRYASELEELRDALEPFGPLVVKE